MSTKAKVSCRGGEENRNRKQKLPKDIRGASMGNQKLVSYAISELINGRKFMWESRVERGR